MPPIIYFAQKKKYAPIKKFPGNASWPPILYNVHTMYMPMSHFYGCVFCWTLVNQMQFKMQFAINFPLSKRICLLLISHLAF